MVNKEKKVSKDKFDAYITVQQSGVTNMMDVRNVIFAADGMCGVTLTKEDCFYIMKNYAALLEDRISTLPVRKYKGEK